MSRKNHPLAPAIAAIPVRHFHYGALSTAVAYAHYGPLLPPYAPPYRLHFARVLPIGSVPTARASNPHTNRHRSTFSFLLAWLSPDTLEPVQSRKRKKKIQKNNNHILRDFRLRHVLCASLSPRLTVARQERAVGTTNGPGKQLRVPMRVASHSCMSLCRREPYAGGSTA